MATAAATSGGRIRRKQLREAQRVEARNSQLQQLKILQEKASFQFEKFKVGPSRNTHDGEDEYEDYLEEIKFEDFLESVLEIPKECLEKNAVQMVKNTAMKNQTNQQRQQGLRQGQAKIASTVPEGHYTKRALLNAVDKYAVYIQNASKVNAIFRHFDKNKDGYLSKSELRDALHEHERKHPNRNVRGVHVFLVVSNKDLDFILEQAGGDHTGTINRAELLPALAAWEELAELHIQDKENGCSCVIL